MKLIKIPTLLLLPAMLLTMAACAAEQPSEPPLTEISDIGTTEPSSLTPSETETAEPATTSSVTENETSAPKSEADAAEAEASASETTAAEAETSITAAAAETETSAPKTENTAAETEPAVSPSVTAAVTAETSAPKPETTPAQTETAATAAAASVSVTTKAETTAASTTVTSAETTTAETTVPPETAASSMRNITTMEIVREMGLGINLGNTLESCGDWINKNGGVSAYETAWGSPIITEKMIKGYAECGFGVLRIPVAWSNLMKEDYTIDPDYMARVKQIVDWTLDSGMYAIVNIHYDGGWWTDFPAKKDECMKKYTRIWQQISEAFKDYPDKLMFESLNEEGGWDSVWNRWSGSGSGKSESYGLLNEINQRFVDTVRGSGGNNGKRHLLIAGYGTDIDLTCDSAFVMPKDSENRCAVSVHYYTPSTFCILEEDADWGKAQPDWGSDSDVRQLTGYMDKLKTHFVDKGIPVIIGEYGVSTGNKTPETIRLFLSSVAKEAYKRELCPVLWDITDVFYSRQQCKFKDELLLEQLMSAKN